MPSQPLRLYQGETHTYIGYKIHTVYKSLYAEQQIRKKKKKKREKKWKKQTKVYTHRHTHAHNKKRKRTENESFKTALTSKKKRD